MTAVIAPVFALIIAITAGFGAAGASSGIVVKPGTRLAVTNVAAKTINMADVPAATGGAAGQNRAMPFLTGRSAAQWAQLKADAATSTATPRLSAALAAGAGPSKTGSTLTPGASKVFLGMADSASICPYFNGCAPPDQAIAASNQYVMQGVNTSFAVYSPTGAIQAGWPKTAQSFFGIPSNSCDAHGPFLSDPRAFYDPNDGRFWVAELQVENAFGVGTGCAFQSVYHIAVSATSNPNGAWHVYAFNMSFANNYAADYTQFGFDSQAVYWGGNMFNQQGTAYEYDEILSAKKAKMENGQAVSYYGFLGMSVNNHLVDTLQPVETEDRPSGPRAGMFINSFDITGDPSGDNCSSSSPCHGVAVWSLANPGTSSVSLTGIYVNTQNYTFPPNADSPSGAQTVDTNDTRIAGTPVYHDGLITYALNTGLNNGTENVSGVDWGQVQAYLNDAGNMTGATLNQQGVFYYTGTWSTYFGDVMPDDEGNLIMVFETSNASQPPSSAYVGRRVTLAPGTMHDNGFYLVAGSTGWSGRWGDYEATSFDGSGPDHIWVAGEHTGSNGDWATGIGKIQWVLGNN